jgi:dipeptidyl aminopeptidase/acylaminoacyl peptidase
VNEERLHELLLDAPLPRSDREQSFAAVRRAFMERERIAWPRRHARHLVLAAAALCIVGAALSPPGLAVLGSLRDAVGRERVEHARTALVALPTPGQVLVQSAKGPWIMQADGSRRLLGSYRDASWSPHGLYVAATRTNQLVALDLHGRVRWALARPQVRFPRWTGSLTDTRIAYLTGSRLHLVAGDGTRDADLCGEPAAAPVAPAWRPGAERQLAYATTRGRVYVLEAETCSLSWRSAPFPGPRLLEWSSDGGLLALVTTDKLVVFHGRRPTARFLRGIVAAAFAPGTHELALVRDGELLLLDADRAHSRPRRIFAGAGRFTGIAWSPDGRWLVLAWQSADQWLFIRSTGTGRLLAYDRIGEQFGGGGFPGLRGWCCEAR